MQSIGFSTSMMMPSNSKILLLYGGSFDPIHYGHINHALGVEEAKNLIPTEAYGLLNNHKE